MPCGGLSLGPGDQRHSGLYERWDSTFALVALIIFVAAESLLSRLAGRSEDVADRLPGPSFRSRLNDDLAHELL